MTSFFDCRHFYFLASLFVHISFQHSIRVESSGVAIRVAADGVLLRACSSRLVSVVPNFDVHFDRRPSTCTRASLEHELDKHFNRVNPRVTQRGGRRHLHTPYPTPDSNFNARTNIPPFIRCVALPSSYLLSHLTILLHAVRSSAKSNLSSNAVFIPTQQQQPHVVELAPNKSHRFRIPHEERIDQGF